MLLVVTSPFAQSNVCVFIGQVALRGGLELRREVLGSSGRKLVPGMSIAMVEVLKASPAASEAVLLHMGALPAVAM
jgi:hypothetical protein